MPSPTHSPYGMDQSVSPFGDLDDEYVIPPASRAEQRTPGSTRNVPSAVTAAAVPNLSSNPNSHSTRNLNSDNSNTNRSSLPATQLQRRLSDFNASSSVFMDSSPTHSSSPRQACTSSLPLKATPTPSSAAPCVKNPLEHQQKLQQEQQQQQPKQEQQSQSVKLPSKLIQIPPPLRMTSPLAEPSPTRLHTQASTQSVPDESCATQPPTATKRRVGGLTRTFTSDTMPASMLEASARQLSNGFSEPNASAVSASRSRATQRPCDLTSPPRRNSEAMEATTSKEVEPAPFGNSNSGGDEEGPDDQQSSSRKRQNKVYANLVIKKPDPIDVPDNLATRDDGTIATVALPGQDQRDEAQIRAAGALGSARMPVFDRAKQVLLTPGLGNAGSPRLRHGRTASGRDDGPLGPAGMAFAADAGRNNSGSNTTPQSARGRLFNSFITPLLRTPVHRQQSSGVNSPLVVDRAVLEEPARSPSAFGDGLNDTSAEDDDVPYKTHMVWQTRQGQLRCGLSPNFLLITVNDRVCIHWYDHEEEVFETDNTYFNVVPGGRHSCYNANSSLDGEQRAMDDGDAEAFEMNHVWNAADDDQHDETVPTSHTLGRLSGKPNAMTVHPQLDKTAATKKVGSGTPLVIHVRTPRPGRVDSMGAGAVTSQMDSLGGTPWTARGIRARRPASEVFLTRQDDGGALSARGNGVSARSEPNLREGGNLLASSAIPLVTGHSRQPSTNWMLQRSITRQSLGENYQTFTICFRKPGDYYFVCSKHKRSMRLHVQVQSQKSLIRWRLVLVVGAAVLTVALIVIVVVVLAYWMQHSTYLFGEGETATDEQYIAFLNIHDLITMKLFPFLAVGVLVVLIVILAAIGWAVYRCFVPVRQGAYTRGVYTSTRRVFVLCTMLLTCALIVLLFVAFGLEMDVMNGVNQFALSLGSGVTNTLNLYSTAVLQVNYVVNETDELFPDIDLPTDQIFNITSDVSDLMSQVVRWTSFVEDIAQVAFRVVPVVIFLCMQLGLFAACLTIGALILHFRKAAVATTWMLAAGFGVFSIACGIEFAVTKLFSNVYNGVVVLRDDPANFGATLGFANGTFVSQLFSYCTITIDDVSVISGYVNDILSNVNKTLDPKAQEEFSVVFKFIEDALPDTLEALVNYTSYVQRNLDVLQKILDENTDQVNTLLTKNVVPLLQTVVSVVQTFQGLVNCQVIRDIVAAAIPIFEEEVKHYNLAVFSFLLIVFGISFVLLVFSTGATYSLRNPRRSWCNMRSGRWFRFRYSYKTHIATLMQNTAAKAREKTAVQWMVHHTQPIMYQLQTVKLVCYSACMLMFFDSILIVLFNEVSRGTRKSKMLQAISYMGCAVLLFLLLAAVFRRAIIRWIFHFCSLMCAAAVLGVSVSQAIVGFVYFGECIDHTRYEPRSLTYSSPVYLTCSATYMGYNLETAIYSIIIFFNSITVVVTLAIQIRYERNLKASFEHRHYVGILSPLEKFFPWLKCIFADYLFVKRIYHGFLIFVTVVLLICFAVLDIGQWSVIRGVQKSTLEDSDIVQVIDPTVGCNGDSRYCGLRANQIIWACAHNAHSSLEDNFVLPNHYYNITHQLSAGVRSFMVDVWYDKINASVSDEEDVYVCHSLCLMGRRPWRQLAREFKEFLDRYPQQVIMIIFEQYVNSSTLGKISDEVGLTKYVWYSDQVAPNFNPHYRWPTLQHMIDSNQRAMMFNDATAASNISVNRPEWLYYAFDFQYENYYETSSVNEWVCDIHRGWCTPDPVVVNCSDPDNSDSDACAFDSLSSSSSSQENATESDSFDSYQAYLVSLDITNCTKYGADELWKNGSAVYNAWFHTNPPNVRSKMSTLNHFITNGAGSPVQASQANQPIQVQSSTYACSSTWNTVVNILAFDFWNIANPLGTIQAMNQNLVKYGPKYNFKNDWAKMLFGTDTVSYENPSHEEKND
ncbi:hypothetical protein NQL31_005178 [Lotmaria passim]